jgi:hypothetical protein
MGKETIISAKTLGQLCMPNFCKRCFWIKLKMGGNLPFQIFPGIFSSIDSYSKKIICSWFDRHNTCPIWLSEIGEVIKYENPPHYSKFTYLDKKSGVLLRGSPDALFIKRDGTYIIADYKTAKYTEHQDELLPIYEVQLNAYALIAQQLGMKVSELVLIYTEPITDGDAISCDNHHNDCGFIMKFSSHIHRITLKPKTIAPLLMQVKKIQDMKKPPPKNKDCKDCKCLGKLIKTVQIPKNKR